MILWVVSGGLGVAYWLKADFLVVDSLAVFSKWIAGVLGVILIAPIATTLWSLEPKSDAKYAPRWVIRYLSIPTFYFAFSMPMYFSCQMQRQAFIQGYMALPIRRLL